MCREETHSCPCLYRGHAKLYFVRKIVCPPDKDCRIRNDPDPKTINQCRNFHTDGEPYVCAICRSDNVVLGLNRGTPASTEEVERALEHMDADYLSELHHLVKQRQSGRRYFLQDDYRTGCVHIGEEFSAELYRTGNSFTEDNMGDLQVIANSDSRGVTYEQDPSQPIYVGGQRGVRNYRAEMRQSRALERPGDQRYNGALDDGGDTETFSPSDDDSGSDAIPETDTNAQSSVVTESEVSTEG